MTAVTTSWWRSVKRRGFCPSCGARRLSQTVAHLVDHMILPMPVPAVLRFDARIAAGDPSIVDPRDADVGPVGSMATIARSVSARCAFAAPWRRREWCWASIAAAAARGSCFASFPSRLRVGEAEMIRRLRECVGARGRTATMRSTPSGCWRTGGSSMRGWRGSCASSADRRPRPGWLSNSAGHHSVAHPRLALEPFPIQDHMIGRADVAQLAAVEGGEQSLGARPHPAAAQAVEPSPEPGSDSARDPGRGTAHGSVR